MSVKKALLFGAGKRVRDAALPAFQRASHLFEVVGLVGRSERTLEVGGQTYPVWALGELGPQDLNGIDLIFLCVSKDAIPKVLAQLAALGPGHCQLLIDTPVVRFKHFRATRHLEAFRAVSVAEDCTTLPWVPLLREAIDGGDIGEVQGVHFEQSAWAYHGLAMAKTYLGQDRVRSGRRMSMGGENYTRNLRLGPKWASAREPRDYKTGSFTVQGTGRAISDASGPGEQLLMKPLWEAGELRGYRLGEREVRLDEDEVSLMHDVDPEARVTGTMEPAKRVGFLRLLRRLHAGELAYPLADALDDMVIDYHLEKFGRYLANPFSSPRSALARKLLRTVTKG